MRRAAVTLSAALLMAGAVLVLLVLSGPDARRAPEPLPPPPPCDPPGIVPSPIPSSIPGGDPGEAKAQVPGAAPPAAGAGDSRQETRTARLLRGIAAAPREMSYTEEKIQSPPGAQELVELGREAVPEILDALRKLQAPGVERAEASWLGTILLEVLDRMKDPSLREAFERMLGSRFLEIRCGALEGLLHLGLPESAPALRKFLDAPESQIPKRNFDRVRAWGALLKGGDRRAIGEIVALSKGATDTDVWTAADVLSQDPTLRAALGFQGPYREHSIGMYDRALLLNAAEEWYFENVLRAPSPHRPPENPEFSEPYGEAKRSAWNTLAALCADPRSPPPVVRCRPVDRAVQAPDLETPLLWMTGSGHGHTLEVTLFRPEVPVVRAYRFTFAYSRKRSAFPEDSHVSAFRCAEMPLETYGSLIAGMRTILEAEVSPWWSGPNAGLSGSTADFVALLRSPGRELPWGLEFCGYPSSDTKPLRIRLSAASGWFREFEKTALAWGDASPDDPARRAFSEVFADLKDTVRMQFWWWVHERMLALARDFGDESIVPAIASFLSEGKPEDAGERRRLCRAINALARLTGVDLRFAADGSARPLEDVLRDYRERFEKK